MVSPVALGAGARPQRPAPHPTCPTGASYRRGPALRPARPSPAAIKPASTPPPPLRRPRSETRKPVVDHSCSRPCSGQALIGCGTSRRTSGQRPMTLLNSAIAAPAAVAPNSTADGTEWSTKYDRPAAATPTTADRKSTTAARTLSSGPRGDDGTGTSTQVVNRCPLVSRRHHRAPRATRGQPPDEPHRKNPSPRVGSAAGPHLQGVDDVDPCVGAT